MRGEYDWPLTYWAVWNQQPEVLKVLLAHGANHSLTGRFGSPLFLAAYNNNPEMVETLLAHGANPNQPDEQGRSPLFHPGCYGYTEMVRMLVENGAEINWQDHEGKTTLYNTAQWQQDASEKLRTLLELKANPNLPDKLGRTPLHIACTWGHLNNIKVLLAGGADPNLPDHDGQTPLYHAIKSSRAGTVKVLLNQGAEISEKLRELPGVQQQWENIRTAMAEHKDNALLALLLTNFNVEVEPMLAEIKDPNVIISGVTPIALAIKHGHPKLIRSLLDKGANPHLLTPSQQLFLNLERPQAFLKHMLLHQKDIQAADLSQLFSNIEYKYPSIGKSLLPELLALLPLYARKVSGVGERLSDASSAITSLYGFTSASGEESEINQVIGSVYRNWGDIGTLGLSFSKWKFDTMGLWKTNGPMTKPPLLVQSGLFKPVPSRPDDEKYFRSFVHYDPASGISVELRRAYIVVSKPGLGSVVIRNSSHHFGRDLLPEPAYYHPEKVYTQGMDLLNPKELTAADSGYMNVLGKTLNRTEESQTLHHGKNRLLLEALQDVMDDYTDWKCGFQGGKAPAGLKAMLEASVLSTANGGVMGPFGKQKNVRLAWVNPYDLPAPIASLDLTQPAVMKEAELYLKVLNRQATLATAQEYETKMPHLMKFLRQGLEQGLELVLTA